MHIHVGLCGVLLLGIHAYLVQYDDSVGHQLLIGDGEAQRHLKASDHDLCREQGCWETHEAAAAHPSTNTNTNGGESPSSDEECSIWLLSDRLAEHLLPAAKMHAKAVTKALAALGLLSLTTAQTPYEVQKPPLDTDWTYEVGTNPWPEYPRPQLRRESWKSLNGLWTWRAAESEGDVDNPPSAGPLDREVLVPSCIESGLSGLQILDVHHMWYETTFEVPEEWDGQRVLLNFESVDYRAVVFVNGVEKTTHTGGYFRFSVDVTDEVKFGSSNDL